MHVVGHQNVCMQFAIVHTTRLLDYCKFQREVAFIHEELNAVIPSLCDVQWYVWKYITRCA